MIDFKTAARQRFGKKNKDIKALALRRLIGKIMTMNVIIAF